MHFLIIAWLLSWLLTSDKEPLIDENYIHTFIIVKDTVLLHHSHQN